MKPRRNLFLGTLVVFALSEASSAATHYWDGSSASWNDVANWSTDSGATTPDPGAVTGINDDAIFNITTVDGNMVVTLDADQSANSLTFDNTGTTAIQANSSGTTARTLTLGSGGITLNGGAGAVTLGGGSNGNTNLAIGSTQSWTNNSSSLLTVTGGLAINNALTIGGSGNTTITGGAPSDLSRIWTGSGGVTKTGAGTLNITGNISSAQGRWTIGNGYGGNFTMEQGAMNLSGISYITLGDSSTANAIYNQTGGTVLLSPAEDSNTRGVYINNSTSGSGTSQFNVSGGSFTVGGTATRIYVGRGANGTTGELNIGGGVGTATVTVPSVLLTTTSGRTGIVNLNANGILETSSITKGSGTGNFYFDGGTLKVRTGTTAGSNILTGMSTAQIKNGGATINTNGIDVTIGQSLTTFSGATTASLTKTGAGTLTLSGTNSYNGGTTVSQGTLKLELGNRSGNTTLGSFALAGGAVLNLDNTNTGVGSLFPSAFVLSGAGTVTKTNVGSIDWWTNSDLTGFTGTIDVQEGAIRLNNLSTGKAYMPQATLNIASGALFDLRYANATGTNLTVTVDKLTGSGTLDHTYPQAGTYNVTVGANDGSSQFDGILQDTASTGVLSLTKTGSGTFTLTGNNSYAGATNIGEGVLRISHANALGSTTGNTSIPGGSTPTSRLELTGGVTFAAEPLLLGARQGGAADAPHLSNLSGNNEWTGAITTTTGGANYNIESQAGFLTISGTVSLSQSGTRVLQLMGAGDGEISSVISGSGSNDAWVRKLGAGTWTLSGANTYTGATTVEGGTLVIGAGGSIANSSTIHVASGASLDVSAVTGFSIGSAQTLSGSGTISGTTDIQGTHNPGNSPGIQTFSSNLSYSGGASVVNWELGLNTETQGSPTAVFDQIVVGGNLDFTDLTTLNLLFNGGSVLWSDTFWDSDQSWTLYDVTGTTSNFSNLQLATTNWLDSGSVMFDTARPDASFSLSLSGEDVLLNYTAVPEPRAAVLGLFGLIALLRRRRA